MGNQKKIPIVHFFKEINIGKYKGVKHYELVEVQNGKPKLSQLINISKDRNCARSKPAYWLKTRLVNKWSKAETGLFKTAINGFTYSGDLENKTHLVLFEFSKDASTLKIFVYFNYFPFAKQLHPSSIAKKIITIPNISKEN